jgi:hypothetical protein
VTARSGSRPLSHPEGNHATRSGSRPHPIFLKRRHVSGSWAHCGSFQTPDLTREPLAAHCAPYGEIGQSHGGARDAYRPKRGQSRISGPGRSDRSLVAGQSTSLGSHLVTPRRGLTHHGIHVASGVTAHCGSTVRWNFGAALEEGCPARFSLQRAARRTRRPELVRWRGANSPPKSQHATLGRQSSTAGHFLPRNVSSWPLGREAFAQHWAAPGWDSGRVEGNLQALPQHLRCCFSQSGPLLLRQSQTPNRFAQAARRKSDSVPRITFGARPAAWY